MKRTIMLPLLLMAGLYSPAISQSPSFTWSKHIRGAVVDAMATTTDDEGNIYVTGRFQDSIGIESNMLYTNSSDPVTGNIDQFVCKFSPDGELLWLQQGGALYAAKAVDISHDSDGYIYVVGNTWDTLVTSNNDTILAPGGDAFILSKYHPDGELEWVKQSFGGWSYGEAITTDKEDNVIAVGITINETTFEDIAIKPEDDYVTIYIAKYDKEGGLTWLSRFEGDLVHGINQVSTDQFGNIYLTGTYGIKMVLGDLTLDAASWNLGGSRDAFIAKYSPEGKALWARTIGGTGDCWGASLTIDENGSIYVAGHMSGTTQVENQTFSNPKNEMFIVKYNGEGDILWAKNYGGGGDQSISHIQYANNKLYISGLGFPKINFGDTTIVSPYSQVVIVLARLDKDGNPEWITHISDHTTGGIRGFDVMGNELVFCGAFANEVFIGDSLFVCEEMFNSFVGKMVDNGITNTNEEKDVNLPLIELFPNPFHDYLNICFSDRTWNTVTVEISSLLGKKILTHSTQSNGFSIHELAALPPGFYTISISDWKNKIIKKIIKQ